MTVYILASTTADNDIDSSSTSYATARAGTGGKALGSAGGAGLSVGQEKNGVTFHVKQSFLQVVTSGILADDVPVSADWSFTLQSIAGSASWTLGIRETDWGTSVDTGDFVPGGSLGALGFFGTAALSPTTPLSSRLSAASGQGLLARLKTAGPIRTVWYSEKQRLSQAPTGDEFATLNSADASGTALDPVLRVCTVPSDAWVYVGAALLQLVDGTHAYLIQDGGTITAPTITLEGDDGTIATVPVGTGATQFAAQPGLQTLALVRDLGDNLYILGPQGSNPSTGLLVQAYVRGAGHTWTARTPVAVSTPSYPFGLINNVVGAWHGTGGAGHLMAVLSHTAGSGKAGEIAYATLSCASLLAGAGTVLVETGADPTWLGVSTGAAATPPTNEIGSSLDIATPQSAVFGAVYCLDNPDRGINGRYTLTAAGTVDPALSGPMAGDGTGLAHDAQSKLRAVAIGTDRVAFVGAGRVAVRNYSGTLLGSVDLAAQGIASFPAAATLAATSAWDALYDAASNRLWVYYVDTGNSGRLRRTAVDLATYQATGDEVLVADETGDVIVDVRVPRIVTDERAVQVDIAKNTGSVGLFDSLNVAPLAPTLSPQSSFDASSPRLFTWTFNDPNSRDTQSAYELQISNASNGASAYGSGKVISTVPQHTLPSASIGNNGSWQWKARTWDAADLVGPFSTLGAFTTTSAGTVTITSPASDNLAGLNTASVTVTWSVTGTTQVQRRIKVVAVATGATLSDTGFVASTSMTAVVSGLLTDVEYRIEVTVKNGSGVISSTGTRLVTPSYSAPVPPVVSAADSGAGYILVTVTNPPPTGDEPEAAVNDIYRRETGTVEWTRIASIAPGRSYQDYAAGSGVLYDYKATAVA